MGKKRVVIDTNVLLDNPEILNRDDLDIVLPYIVLHELDGLKRNRDLSYPARTAIKIIKEKFEKGTISITDIPKDADTNDEVIVNRALQENCMFMTGDVGASVIALAKNIEVYSDDVKSYDENYIGYSYAVVPHKIYYKFLNNINEAQIPELEEYVGKKFQLNEYVICKPDDGSLNRRIFRRLQDKYVLLPEGKNLLRGITKDRRRLDFEFLHEEQICAFDAVFNTETPLAIVQGSVGVGKNLIATLAAIARVDGAAKNRAYNRILVTRPNVPINKDYEIGFLPGSSNDKLRAWLSGFVSNLQFLFNHSKADFEEDIGNQVFEEFFIPVDIGSIQGSSFNKDILIVDEAQLLDVNTLNQIMSRVATGSKLVLLLDPKQAYGRNRGNEGYRRLFPYIKGSKYISYVNLQHIQRGELTKFVYEIFNKENK